MHLVQFRDAGGARGVALLNDGPATATRLNGVSTTYDLARAAMAEGTSLAAAAKARKGESIDLQATGMRLLPPIDHPDPAHCLLTLPGPGSPTSVRPRGAIACTSRPRVGR